MATARDLFPVCVVVAVTALASTALAQPKLPPIVGAAEVTRLTTPAGFIDDPVTVDGDRVAYVVADSSSKAELHVLTLASKQEQVVDISAATLYPLGVTLVGPRALVVGQLEDGKQLAAMVELADKGKLKAGAVAYKTAPADHVTVIKRDGKPRIALHRTSPGAAGTKHEVELVAIENGRRVGAARTLELGAGDVHKALDFRVNHWSEGWTRAHGIKGGEWDRKENQRSPDTEATYDLVTGKLVDRKKIADLFEQRRRFAVMAEAAGKTELVRVEKGALQLWRNGTVRALELDQPLASYDTRSLQTVVLPDGTAWLALKVDPVNPDAVARKKADPEYLDIFVAAPDGKAVRKARVLAAGARHRFGVIGGDRFWLLERNQSMERGGKSLAIYQVQ